MGRTPTRTLSAALLTTALVASTLAAAPATATEIPAMCNGHWLTKRVDGGTYTGTIHDDIVVVTGSATLDLGEGNDSVCVYNQTGRVTVRLGAGNDTLLAGGNTHTIYAYGGTGNDYLQGGEGNNYLYGDAGNDTLSAPGKASVLYGDTGDDRLYGGYQADSISGGSGKDFVEAGGGNDVIQGGAGTDTIYAGIGDDHVVGGLGHDNIFGGHGDDSIWGDTEYNEGEDISWANTKELADSVNSGYGSDAIYGEEGNDKLVGDRGNDLLDGGPGDDYLEGGPGSDQLWAGYDIKKADGTWQQVTGDVLIGDYYETRTNGGFSSDRDLLASRAGAEGNANQRPGIVKHAYGGAGEDVIVVVGISSLTRSDGKETIKRTGSSKAHGGTGNDHIIALYMEKVEATAGADTIRTVDVPEILGGSGNDTIIPVKWTNAYGGDGDDTFNLCQSPTSKHGYSWGEGGTDKWVGSGTVFKGVDPKDTPALDGFKSYENKKASTIPSRYTHTTVKSDPCPSGHDPAKVKLTKLQPFFDKVESWGWLFRTNLSLSMSLPEPWQ